MSRTKDIRHNIPAMTPTVVHDYLWETGARWTGKGVAVELGAWLGATSVPLMQGLKQAGYKNTYWVFDRWRANDQQVGIMRNSGIQAFKGQSLYNIYLDNVKDVYGRVKAVRGDIPTTLAQYDGEAIEIMLFDAPKQNPTFINSMQALLPYCIPGVTVIGLLDYYWYKDKDRKMRKRLRAPVDFVEQHSGCFELLAHWPDQCSCAFFKYKKEVKL